MNLQTFIDLNLNEDNQIVEKLKRAIEQCRGNAGYLLPVLCVSGQSRLTGPIFSCLIESRCDGPSFNDFMKQLADNIK